MAEHPKRNAPCHCGSNKKYKNCCIDKDRSTIISKAGITGLILLFLVGAWFLVTAISGEDSTQSCPTGTTWSASHQHCH
ncbi:MAG: SEC-C domain-containing protein [Gracilimonas sp.]|uniref:SEC-C metal-binding domain-containing protein n=1 Tax=Gracilimonas sp. TaxID=1974203 RepID=UPI0019A84635|nr:SEC-C domain-containing protein [Gracilimonas sp.]